MHHYPVLFLALVTASGVHAEPATTGQAPRSLSMAPDPEFSGEAEAPSGGIDPSPDAQRPPASDPDDGLLPMGIMLYPGAVIQSRTAGSGESQSTMTLVFTSSDNAEQVLGFYRTELESKNIMFKKEIRSGDVRTIAGEQSTGDTFRITVTALPDGGVTATIVAGRTG